MAAIFNVNIPSFRANVYLADFGVTDIRELVGAVVTVAIDSDDLSIVKALPFLGTGPFVGHISAFTDVPVGYTDVTAGTNPITVTVRPTMQGFNTKAAAAIPAGSFVKANTAVPFGVVATTTEAEAFGIALEPGQLGLEVPVVVFTSVTTPAP